MQKVVLALFCAATAAFVVVQPDGPYGVAQTDLELVDTSREDPYSGASQRTLPISVFAPTGPSTSCQQVQQNYMPELTAQFWERSINSMYKLPVNDTVSQTFLSLCEASNAPGVFPLIVFSTGLGLARQLYNILSSRIAAYGFTVITLDTPGQTFFIEYLDGSVQIGVNITTDDDMASAVEVRTKDVLFVLDRISSGQLEHCTGYGSSDSVHTAVYGHSLGGATALSAVTASANVLGGANLDGVYRGEALNHTTAKPFLLFTDDNPTRRLNWTSVPSWALVWSHLDGPKWQFIVNGSLHNTFTDLPVLADLYGFYEYKQITAVLGSIDPQQFMDIMVSVLSNLGGYIFGRNCNDTVLQAATTFPEVIVNGTDPSAESDHGLCSPL